MPEVKTKPLRIFYTFLGFLSLTLGFMGLFLPLLPTTPFLLLAAFCFSKGSNRFHQWLIRHPKLGPPIRDWEESRAIKTKYKILATLMVILSFSISFYVIEGREKLKFGLSMIMLVVMMYVWSRPSKAK